jgi:hypothetical protein
MFTFWISSFPASLFGCRYHIWRLRHECLHQRVVRNNLTKREGDFIYLRSRDNSAVNKLISDLKNIYHFVKQFGNQVKVVFLQLFFDVLAFASLLKIWRYYMQKSVGIINVKIHSINLLFKNIIIFFKNFQKTCKSQDVEKQVQQYRTI